MAEKGLRPLKILIAIGVTRQKEAGAAGVVLNQAKELAKRGHSIECWFLEDVLEKPAKPKRLEAFFFARALAKRIRREPDKFDLVNIHAPWGCVYGVWKQISGKRGVPPYVMTMHGSEERYVRAMSFEERKGRATNFSWRNRFWHRIYHQTMFDYSIKTADYGATVNREAWVCAELKYKRKPGLIWYVPNGVEETFFIPRDFSHEFSGNLLYVGTWLDRKGVYYLAEAFALTARKIAGLRLTVAGCSTPEEQVREMFPAELRDRVNVIPFVTREGIAAIYAGHDIFVLPSLVEGMPLTLLESMATAMPVVTTNTCGMSDVVEDEINGLLVPPADAEKLAKSIERLCHSAELRMRLGLAGQETMRRYTWNRVTEKLESIFELALRNSRN